LAEIKWKDLKTAQTNVRLKIVSCDNLYWRTSGDFGCILYGENRYSVYAADNRTLEISRAYHTANGYWVYDGCTGIGYCFRTPHQQFEIAPLVGFSMHGQHLLMADGDQKISIFPEDIGPVRNFRNRYKTLWQGGFAGVDLAFNYRCWHFYAQGEWHWAAYHAKGRWERQRVFRERYVDKAQGHGQVYTYGINYTNNTDWQWSIGVVGNYQLWHTRPGRHVVKSFVRAADIHHIQHHQDSNQRNHHHETDKKEIQQLNQQVAHQDTFVDTLPINFSNKLNPITWYSYSLSITLDTYF
jgi:hypothetical protein